MRRMSILMMIVVCVGCTSFVPATTPPQLVNTPGAFIHFDMDSLYSDYFAINTPTHWRIIRVSPATDLLHLVMVSPDDTMRIDIALAPLGDAEPESEQVYHDQIVLGATTIYILGQASVTDGQFESLYRQVLDSVRLPQAGR